MKRSILPRSDILNGRWKWKWLSRRVFLDGISQRVPGICGRVELCLLRKLGKWSEEQHGTRRLTNSHWAESEGAVLASGCSAATWNHPNGPFSNCSLCFYRSQLQILLADAMSDVRHVFFLPRPRFWLGRWRASLWRRSERRRRPLSPPTAATSTPSSAGSCAFWVSCTRRDWRLFSFCAVRHGGSLRLFCKPPPQFRPPVASLQFASVDLFSSSPCLPKFPFKVQCVKLCLNFWFLHW